MEFITDGMLGKVTRWLRMLGYNVRYGRSLGDRQLIKIAQVEHRILLTRDLELHKQAIIQGINAFLVNGITGAEKLASLATQVGLKLEIDMSSSRCPKCNKRLLSISKDKIISKVPTGTYSSYNKFWECPGCEQVYWVGAHWKQITNTLRKANQLLKK